MTPLSASPLAPAAPAAQPPGSPVTGDTAGLATAARQFEAIFVRQMLSSARAASFGDDLLGSSAQDTFREMRDSRFADIAADKGVFGLAQAIERQLSARMAATPAPAATEKEA